MSNRFSQTALVVLLLLAVPIAAEAQRNCERFLEGETYLCRVKSDFGSDFVDCLTFSDGPIIGPEGFPVVPFAAEFLFGGFFSPLGCTCSPTGSLFNPRFDRSNDRFHCVGHDRFFADFSISFSGPVQRFPRPHIVLEGVNNYGDSFYAQCNRDRNSVCPAMGPLPTRPQSRGKDNPWVNPRRDD